MSKGPVPGNGLAISLPRSKVVFWSVLVQSSADQFVQLQDSQGLAIFTVRGASTSGGVPTQIGQGFFAAADPADAYTVWIGTDNGQRWSQVLWSQASLATASSPLFSKYVFASEDGTDADYNDSYLQMQWFEYLG